MSQRVAEVLASLQAVRSAMDAERSPGAAGLPQGARVLELLRAFEASLHTLRARRVRGVRMSNFKMPVAG